MIKHGLQSASERPAGLRNHKYANTNPNILIRVTKEAKPKRPLNIFLQQRTVILGFMMVMC
jgi:hypothetical protein